MDSRCGGCTMCCTTTAVPELQKPARVACAHCVVGEGCRIYATRPGSCRGFECAWYRDPQLSDRLRPDRCGVALEVLGDSRILLAMVDRDRPNIWKLPLVSEWFRRLLGEGFAIVVHNGIDPDPLVLIPAGRSAADTLARLRQLMMTAAGRFANPAQSLQSRPSPVLRGIP